MRHLRRGDYMKYRTRLTDDICSLEELFTGYLGLSVPVVPQTGSYSNKHTINRLFFSRNIQQCSNIDEILSYSVFKDSEYDRLKAQAVLASKPLYYMIHPDENFPTGSKLSVLFSNIANKNFTGKEQAPDVRMLLHAVDYDKLCTRISFLIDRKSADSEDAITNIEAYISKVLTADSELTRYCSIFHCAAPCEYLATFLLYSFFDDINFVEYANEVSVSRPDVEQLRKGGPKLNGTQLNNPHFQNLMNEARHVGRLQAFATYTFITLYSVQMLCAIISTVWFDTDLSQDKGSILFGIGMLSLSIILTAMRFIPFSLHRRYSGLSLLLEHSALDEDRMTYSVTYNNFQNCSKSFNRIQRGRHRLITCFCLLSACYIALSFAAVSFPLLVALVAVTFAVVLLIDSVSHDIVTYRRYDAYFRPDGMTGGHPSARSGLARICSWDYDVNMNEFRHTQYDRLTNYSEDCIRHIYNQVVDTSTYTWATLTAFIVTLSSIGVLAEIMQLAFPDLEYFRMPSPHMLYYVTMGLILINGVINIIMLLQGRTHYQKMSEFSYYAGNPSSDGAEASELFRRNLYSGSISDLEVARGIYNYDMCLFEEGTASDDIQPQDDRYHLMYILKQKTHLITDVALCFLVAYFSMAVWHTNNPKNALAIPFFTAIYAAYTFALYPALKTHSVIKELQRLHRSNDC